jgi:16S rRNA (cytidine1402-2'-O)-methyltransferase
MVQYGFDQVFLPMPGLLSVVATPIGNLEDVTLRSLRTLREADLIAAEDTRHTAKLLRHFGIATPTVSFHAHNVRNRLPQVLRKLSEGQHIALVSDAGTPGVSDPGVELVSACWQAGIKVEPIPGASAPLTAVVASGFPMIPFTVFGFPPVRSQDRSRWFEEASTTKHTFAFFEAPHRISRCLEDCKSYFGTRPIMVAREATKVHEEFIHLRSYDITSRFADARGEFTLVVGPAESVQGAEAVVDDVTVWEKFQELAGQQPGATRRDLIAGVAAATGLKKNAVFSALERARSRE